MVKFVYEKGELNMKHFVSFEMCVYGDKIKDNVWKYAKKEVVNHLIRKELSSDFLKEYTDIIVEETIEQIMQEISKKLV